MVLIVANGSAIGQTPAAAASSPASRAASTGPSWSRLTPQQRSALLPLERDWSSIDAPRKTKWLEVAARFPAMPVADQKRVQERMAEWARMTPSERGRARLSFQESKQFSPEQKQAHWEAYQALPDNERRALADRNQPSAVDKPASAASAKHSRVASRKADPRQRRQRPTAHDGARPAQGWCCKRKKHQFSPHWHAGATAEPQAGCVCL